MGNKMAPEEKAKLENALSTLDELLRLGRERVMKFERRTEDPTQAQKELTKGQKLLIRAQELAAEIQNRASTPKSLPED
jgi:hypothetical protein